MSHAATIWAIEQRGISHAAKVVLWQLCDRYHPERGCFPSQGRLCHDAEVKRSSLNNHLNELEEAGLIRRVKRHDTATKRRLTTRYHFAFEDSFNDIEKSEEIIEGAVPEPCPESGHGNVGEPCPKNGQSHVQNSGSSMSSQLDNEPVREPFEREARARDPDFDDQEPKSQPPSPDDNQQGKDEGAGCQAENIKTAEKTFWALVKDWPNFAGMPKKPALKAFLALSPQDRRAACEGFENWHNCLKSQKRRHIPAPSTYFSDRLWQDVPAPPERADKPAVSLAPPFGPLWMAGRLARIVATLQNLPPLRISSIDQRMLENGQITRSHIERRHRESFVNKAVSIIDRQAENRIGWGFDPVFERLTAQMEPVPVGSPVFDDWRAFFGKKGWPWLPDPGRQKVIYFPAGGPEAFGDFEKELKGIAGDSGAGDQRKAG